MDNYQVRTLQKKRTTNFREDETKLLISLWGSPVIQNKLYLTHRKAPVMRLLAANMQQRGFYRSPDEIKTRIRNLKCLYHRIKRTMVTGSGIGTVDPDWPHFKAMDAILGKENGKNDNKAKMLAVCKDEDTAATALSESLLEGPRCEDIKQEIELDINDDMESWNGNDSLGGGSDFEESHIPATSIVKATLSLPQENHSSTNNILQQHTQLQQQHTQIQLQQQRVKQLPTLLPNIPMSTTQQLRPNGTIPLPLLILNGIHSAQPHHSIIDTSSTNNGNNSVVTAAASTSRHNTNQQNEEQGNASSSNSNNLSNILREILSVQNQQLDLERQKFELEKQRLEFDRVVGSQLMTLVPMVGGLLQRLVYPSVQPPATPSTPHAPSQQQDSVVDAADSAISCDDNEAESKDKPLSDYDILKDSKILRTVLERGIKKYMMADETRDSNKDNDEDEDEDSENDDSGINENHHLLIENDNSNSNSK